MKCFRIFSRLVSGFPLCLLFVAGHVSADTSAYVQGVHVTRTAQYDSNLKMYAALGCSFADQLALMQFEEYFAIVEGQPIHAEYVKKTTVERIPGPPTGLCPFVPRPVEEVSLTHYGKKKKYKSSSAKGGKWTVEDLATLPAAKFSLDAIDSMAAAKGYGFKPTGWDKVAGVRCDTYVMHANGSKVETCIANEKELQKWGVTFPKQLGMRYVQSHKDGADTKKVDKIDFKAKVPLSLLLPPKSVTDAPRKASDGSSRSRRCAAEKARTGIDPCEADDD